jgi:cellulose synthase/poly-beta-1,6-N-acetylglucosamine synthase-like glycosyltransferase
MGFVYVPSTFVWFKTPQNLTDHLKQSIRFRAGLKELMNLFSKSIVEKEFRIPLKVKISVAIKFFTETPVLFIGYTFILVLSALFSKFNLGREAMWSTAETSKSLI